MNFIFFFLTLLFIIIATQRLQSAVLLTLVLLPSYLLRTSVAGVPITLLEIMILVCIFVFILKYKPLLSQLASVLKQFQRNPIGTTLILLVLVATVSIFVAQDNLSALGIYKAYYLEPIAFGVMIFFLVRNKHLKTDQCLNALTLGALFVSLVAIIQYIIPSTIPIPWDIERRVTSVFAFPNAVGLLLAPIVTLAWLNMFTRWKDAKTHAKNVLALWISTAVLGTLAIVLAKSEAAIVAIVATLIIAMLIDRRRRGLGIFFAILALFAILAIPALQQKLLLQDASGHVRRSQWSETFDMLKDNAVLGVGLSGYPKALIPYHKDTQYEIFQYPHNIFLNVWSELGLTGLLVLIACVVFLVRKIASTPPAPGNDARFLPVFALVTILIHGLVDVPIFKNDLAVLTAVLIALTIYGSRKKV